MYRLTINFRNGLVVTIICDEYSFSTVANKISEYNIKGIVGQVPVYMDPEEIICITKEMMQEKENDQNK